MNLCKSKGEALAHLEINAISAEIHYIDKIAT